MDGWMDGWVMDGWMDDAWDGCGMGMCDARLGVA